MMTVATVEMSQADDVPGIDVDIDDNGYAYIKQNGKSQDSDERDWIAFPLSKVPALIAALQEIRL